MRRGVSSNISWILFCTSSMSTATDRRGNRVLITISLINLLVLYPGTKLYYKWRNNQRDKMWNRMSPEVSGIVESINLVEACPIRRLGEILLLGDHEGCREPSIGLQICALTPNQS